MRGNVIETVMGGVVLIVAAVFLYFAYNTSQVRAISGYDVTATFNRVDGIKEGSDVRVSGIKVGSVLSTTLKPNFDVTVTMSIAPSIKLPDDSSAEIISSGLLGDKYMALVPGGSEKTISPGGEIKYTQSPVSLENLIGQMIFSKPEEKKPESGGAAAPPGGAAPAEGGAPAPTPGGAPAPEK